MQADIHQKEVPNQRFSEKKRKKQQQKPGSFFKNT